MPNPNRSPQVAQLQEKVHHYLRENAVSRPEFLTVIGIERSDNNFETYIKTIERFEGGNSAHLQPHLRAKLLDFFREELPEVDVLDLSFYGEHISICESFHELAKEFYKIRPSRVEELKKQALGRYFLYKKPVNPHNEHLILRTYAKILIPHEHNFAMVLEYQKCTYESKDVGKQVDHDFYVGFATKKDGALILMTRQIDNGALKTSFFDTITTDYDSRQITRGYGQNIETCDGFSPSILATSGCAIQKIPERYTMEQIEPLVDNVACDDIDNIIADHIMRRRQPPRN